MAVSIAGCAQTVLLQATDLNEWSTTKNAKLIAWRQSKDLLEEGQVKV